jgi:hypothetical protein
MSLYQISTLYPYNISHIISDVKSDHFPLSFSLKNLYVILVSYFQTTCQVHHNLHDSVTLILGKKGKVVPVTGREGP